MSPDDPCPSCGTAATRPDVVWFGEFPYHPDKTEEALAEADLFAAIGPSGQVYPAAAFGQMAREMGAHTVELNLEPSAASQDFHECRLGKASLIVPTWVDEILSMSSGG